MGTIYQKLTKKTVILAPREGYQRAFDFGDWSEIRMGVFYSGVTSGGDDTNAVSETVVLGSVNDRITFGIKNSSNLGYPGTAGTLFVGGSNSTAASRASKSDSVHFFVDNTSYLSAIGFAGVTVIGGGDAEVFNVPAQFQYPDASLSTGYCGFFGMKFVLSNRGLSSQSFAVSAMDVPQVLGTDYSSAALRTLINNSTYSSPKTIAWNDGAVARVVPDAYYIRMPFYNNRIRIACMRISRYA